MIETRGDVYRIIACRADASPCANNPATAAIGGVVGYARFAFWRRIAIGKSRGAELPAPGSSTTLTLAALATLATLAALAALAGAAAGAEVTYFGITRDEKNHGQRDEIRLDVHWSHPLSRTFKSFATREAQGIITAMLSLRQEGGCILER